MALTRTDHRPGRREAWPPIANRNKEDVTDAKGPPTFVPAPPATKQSKRPPTHYRVELPSASCKEPLDPFHAHIDNFLRSSVAEPQMGVVPEGDPWDSRNPLLVEQRRSKRA